METGRSAAANASDVQSEAIRIIFPPKGRWTRLPLKRTRHGQPGTLGPRRRKRQQKSAFARGWRALHMRSELVLHRISKRLDEVLKSGAADELSAPIATGTHGDRN